MNNRTVEERLALLEAAVDGLRAQAPVNVDTDQYADFAVRKSPPRWISSGGVDYVGKKLSETSADFCDALAQYLDWTAEMDEKNNKTYVNGKGETVAPAKYARKDAARARAWAVKLRAKPNVGQQVERQIASNTMRGRTQQYLGPQEDDEIPF